MVKQCVREGSGFGVVTLNGGNEYECLVSKWALIRWVR
jgi:hypothetical protein